MKAMRMSDDTFSLTPVLSLKGRENRAPSFAMSCAGEIFGDRKSIQEEHMLFPLSAGEGKGGGESVNQQPTHDRS